MFESIKRDGFHTVQYRCGWWAMRQRYGFGGRSATGFRAACFASGAFKKGSFKTLQAAFDGQPEILPKIRILPWPGWRIGHPGLGRSDRPI